ncbi:MAG TPA: GYF domain-containing protein [Tepidisphaeraceae bacterium]|jgi:hypothetical protein|nr:GYF domain-containing protein [Tepidisphaeraceae bacterium]
MTTGAVDQFHYSRDGQPAGPVTKRVLLQMIATGKLRASDLIYDERAKQWRRVFEHPEFVEDDAPIEAPPVAASKASHEHRVAGASAVLPGQYAVYKAYKPVEKHDGKARAAYLCGLIGIIVLPLGLIAAYLGADALAGINRTGNTAGKKDAMTGLVLGIAELVAAAGLIIWWSTQYSFIDLVNR